MLADENIIRNDTPDLFTRIKHKCRKQVAMLGSRKRKNRKMKNQLLGMEFSIFSNNCLGGVFCHDAGKIFRSPTVNLAFDGEEFIKFLENPNKYLYGTFTFKTAKEVSYPVADVEDIEIRFVHYKTYGECIEAWKRRVARIDWKNLFIIATDNDGLNRPDLMERFNQLKYENKLMFTAKKYPQYEWAVFVPEFEGLNQVQIMTGFADLKGTRYYETCFDLVAWITERFNKRK